MNTPQHQPYHDLRKRAALARWKRAAELRKQGKTYKTIGAMMNVSLSMAFKLIVKYQNSKWT